jgi:hypothetical protein
MSNPVCGGYANADFIDTAILMEAKKPRAPRTPLTASAEVVDVQSGKSQSAQTLDLSVAGCYLETPNPLPLRSAIRLKLLFNESSITLFGDVVRSEPGKGMGVRFRALEPGQISVLKGWFFAADRPDW